MILTQFKNIKTNAEAGKAQLIGNATHGNDSLGCNVTPSR